MRHRRSRRPSGKYLEFSTQVTVRFQEVDALRIVWHGHYLSYFESGRVAFGKEYGLNYTDFVNAQLITPVVHASCDYIRSATFGDEITVVTRLYPQVSARLHYHFEIQRSSDGELLATGETVHVFSDMNNELCLTIPKFMAEWYARWKPEMEDHG